MARNVEIKARVKDMEALKTRAAEIADEGPTEILQDDTFFNCGNGRLKLRAFSESRGELIFYRRPDRPGPKESSYVISETEEPASLREVLKLAYGEAGRLRKRRTLYRTGRTRIHLDRVEGLGDFLELEVVLADNEPPEAGVEVAYQLMERLAVEPDQLIEGAYVDLLSGDGV